MEKKMFRSYLLLITFAVSLVLVITKIDLLVGALGIVLRLFRPFFIGFAIAFYSIFPMKQSAVLWENMKVIGLLND